MIDLRIGASRTALAPAGIAVLAAVAILVRQREFGPGFSWDAVQYVCAARNLLAGSGVTGCDGGPMTPWAPLYPALLALASLPGFDPQAVAGPLNAVFFGAFVLSAGLWLRRSLESRFLAVWGCLALALSIPLTRMFSYAMSEAPFLLFASLALICADRALGGGGRRWLAWAATFTALAWATRYVGAVVAVTVGAALILERGTPYRKAKRFLAYALAAAAPVGAWMARNLVETGWPVARAVEVNYSFSQAFAEIARAVGGWTLHIGPIYKHPHELLGGAALLLLLSVGVGWRSAYAIRRSARPRERSFLLFGGFALAYVAFYAWTTVSGHTWHGVSPRHLMPIYAPVLFAALLAADRIVSAGRLDRKGKDAGRSRAAPIVLAAALVFWLPLGAYPQMRETLRGDLPGASYRSPRWAGSEAVRYLRAEAPGGAVWSNDHYALHLFAGGTADFEGLPSSRPIGVTVDVGDYPDALEELRRRQRARGGGHLVWLRDVGFHPADYDADDIYALPEARLLAALEDGLAFRIGTGRNGGDGLPAATPRSGRGLSVSGGAFDVHFRAWGGRTRLVFVERECGGGDATFLLRVWPARAADLSDRRRRYGFDEFEFEFGRNRVRYGDMCVASATLPEYDIARASTGPIGGGPFRWAEFRPGSGGRKDPPAL